MKALKKHFRLFFALLLVIIGGSFFSNRAYALSAASNNFYAGQTHSFAGHYRLISIHSSTFSFTLNSGDQIVGAYSGYGSEMVGTALPSSDAMTMNLSGKNYTGTPTAQLLFSGNGDYLNSAGQLTNDGKGLPNGIMQANDFSSVLSSLGAGTYQASLDAASSDVTGAGYGKYYTYLVIENASLPLQEVVVNTFAMGDYGQSSASQTVNIPTKAGIAPSIGQAVNFNSQVTTADPGDTLTLALDGITGYSGASDTPSGSVSTTAQMQSAFAAGKLNAQVNYSNSAVNAPEVIQGFGISLPMTAVAMNYQLLDSSGALIPFNGTFGGSFTSQEAGSSAQAENITQGQLTLTGVLGDTFPTLSAPTLPNYTFISGPTLNSGGSYSPTATNPSSTATYTYYKNAQHTTQVVDQNGTALVPPVTTSGSDGTAYNSTAPTLSGYSLQSTTGAISGTYDHTVGDTTTTFHYTNVGTVTLHFLDSETKQALQPAQVLTGTQLQGFTITPPTLAGYRFDSTLSSALTGTYQGTNTDLNLYYDQQSTVTINLIDASTHAVLHSETLTGYAGDSYSYALPHFQNYQLPPNPSVTGNFTDNSQTITVSYVKATGTLTLNYINAQTGKAILPSEQYINGIGDWSVIHIPNIAGYDYLNTGVEVAFQQLLPNQTRTLYYDPNLDTVKVDFVNQNGHTIAPSQTITGYYGSSRTVKAQPVNGYQVASGELSSYNVNFNQLYQHLVFKYQPIKESITFRFVNDAGQQVYAPKTITGAYGSYFSYTPQVPWYDSLTYASQKKIVGRYSQPKTDIVVHYTRRQSQINVVDIDNWGNILKQYTLSGYEGNTFISNSPYYWYLRIANSSLITLRGTYKMPKASMAILYNHFKTTITVRYYGVNGTFLDSSSNTGFAGDSYGFQAPLSIGYYNLVSNQNYSGYFGAQNKVINIYYSYNPPVTTYTVSKEVTTTTGKYVPVKVKMNFDEPMSEWTTEMKEMYFRYGKATFTDPSSKEYRNFYTTVYKWEGITTHYTTTETKTKTATGSGGTNNDSGNWLVDEGKSQTAGYFAGKAGEKAGILAVGEGLESKMFGPLGGAAFTFGTEYYSGKGLDDAIGKSAMVLGLGLLTVGFVAAAPTTLAAAVVGGIGVALSIGFSALYDYAYDKKGKK